MHGFVEGSGRIWRRLTAGVLICALLLQGVAFVLEGARLAAAAAGTADWASFELCRHDGGAVPDGTPESPAADSHCIFCLAGATYVLGGSASTPKFRTIAFAVVPWPFVVWRLPADTVDASARPRGPPTAA
jgi:hypothetical protein